MLPRVLLVITLAAFVLLSALLQVTSPATMHPAGILLVYVLLYLLALGILTLFLQGIFRGLHAVAPNVSKKDSFTRAYYLASVLALMFVVAIAMMSIGRLAVFEMVLICFFGIIACVYVSKKY